MASRGLWNVQIDDARFRANVLRLAGRMEAEARTECVKAADRFEKHP